MFDFCQEDNSLEGNLRKKKSPAENIEGNIQRKDILWGVGSREEIGISGRGNFPSFLSLFEKGGVCRRKKGVLQQNCIA